MGDKITKSPHIRFAGFTDAWEQCKVGEFLTESKIKGSDGSIAKKLTVKLWRKGIVPKEEIYKGSSATQYYVRKSGQFMYGKLDFLNQAFGIVPPELDGYESTLDSPSFDFQDGINSRFFLEYISLKRFYKYQGNIANGSRKAKRIHAETFFEMPIPVPSHNEQQTIGLFFEQLDTTITLHQRKLDLLKVTKKSMLQKMFPKDGENVPEIRFAGFTDAWEQCKLGDVIDVRSGRDYKHLSNGDIPVYGTGGYMLSVNEALSYDEDAIGIGRKGTIDKPYILKAPFWTVDTLFYAVPREKYNLDFLFSIFQNINWKKKDESTGVPSLSKTSINSIEVKTPNYSEQKIIGEYFSNIDNIITLHQRELDLLKDLKKSMLQQMFI